jgi:Zn-dependent protease
MPTPWLTVDSERESVVFRLPDGTPVYTHYSFSLIALLVTAPLWLQGRLAGVGIAALLMTIMYLSILAHELGHKAAAQRQDARTTSIEIGFYGGMAHLEWDCHRGIAMRPIALAGPAVNLALAGLFFALYWPLTRYGAEAPTELAPFQTAGILSRTLFLAYLLNLWLALFNLLPAYPLDGGTIAEDLLGTRLGIRRARLIVGICGVMVAAISVVVAFATVLAGVPVLVLASFAANRDAIRENWIKSTKRAATSQPSPERVTSSVVQFRKRGGSL